MRPSREATGSPLLVAQRCAARRAGQSPKSRRLGESATLRIATSKALRFEEFEVHPLSTRPVAVIITSP